MSANNQELSQETGLKETRSRRIPELDGLRGLAILLVILCRYLGNANHGHMGFALDLVLTGMNVGWSGVELFFVLSGFLIGGILLQSRQSPRYFRTFYLRRTHRILPIYYLWIILYAVIVAVILFVLYRPTHVLPDGELITQRDFWAFPHYFLFLQNIIYSPTKFQWIWFAVTWSLAVEEQFYLVIPLLVRYLSERTLVVLLMMAVCISPVLRWLSFIYLPSYSQIHLFSTPCHSDSLAVGVLCAIWWRRASFRKFLETNPDLLLRIFLSVYSGVIVVGLLWWLCRPVNVITLGVGESVLNVFYAALLLLVLSQTSSIPAQIMRWGWIRSLGAISYCVYLLHMTINQLAHRILLHSEPRIYDSAGIAVTIGALLFTLLRSSLSWRFIERPLIHRGHSISY
jgi:peptidoglycan/LPS O-acetylase OafA/YrhL